MIKKAILQLKSNFLFTNIIFFEILSIFLLHDLLFYDISIIRKQITYLLLTRGDRSSLKFF